jgi:hypothetical protein
VDAPAVCVITDNQVNGRIAVDTHAAQHLDGAFDGAQLGNVESEKV